MNLANGYLYGSGYPPIFYRTYNCADCGFACLTQKDTIWKANQSTFIGNNATFGGAIVARVGQHINDLQQLGCKMDCAYFALQVS